MKLNFQPYYVYNDCVYTIFENKVYFKLCDQTKVSDLINKFNPKKWKKSLLTSYYLDEFMTQITIGGPIDN